MSAWKVENPARMHISCTTRRRGILPLISSWSCSSVRSSSRLTSFFPPSLRSRVMAFHIPSPSISDVNWLLRTKPPYQIRSVIRYPGRHAEHATGFSMRTGCLLGRPVDSSRAPPHPSRDRETDSKPRSPTRGDPFFLPPSPTVGQEFLGSFAGIRFNRHRPSPFLLSLSFRLLPTPGICHRAEGSPHSSANPCDSKGLLLRLPGYQESH